MAALGFLNAAMMPSTSATTASERVGLADCRDDGAEARERDDDVERQHANAAGKATPGLSFGSVSYPDPDGCYRLLVESVEPGSSIIPGGTIPGHSSATRDDARKVPWIKLPFSVVRIPAVLSERRSRAFLGDIFQRSEQWVSSCL